MLLFLDSIHIRQALAQQYYRINERNQLNCALAMLKLAFLGIKSGEHEENLIGLRVYTVSVDKAIDIVQNHGPKGLLCDTKFNLIPEKECHVLCSGRESPFSSKGDVLEMVDDIDVLIVTACTEFVFARLVLFWLTPETLPKACTVVLRLPFPQEERPFLTYPAVEWLSDMELSPTGKSLKRKYGKSRKTFVIGLEEYGGILPDKGIPMLHEHLLQKVSVSKKLSKPLEETAIAGKSLFGILSNWIANKFST